ncbi:hypothetical protein ACM26V_04095 [Salipaludibacillus sp. HK11]|uniref:hypothetical protein n=1 Tax=Salipaludibacillus sp. HK11 TaxID=3394320 RepID=UPI0039FD83A4
MIEQIIDQIAKWIPLVILIISSISLIVVFQSNYIAEPFAARAIPLAIVIGLSSIATSLSLRK